MAKGNGKVNPYSNVVTDIAENDKLVVTINLDPAEVEPTPSKSGKSMIIATSGGAIQVAPGLKLNLTLYRPV